MKTPSQNDDPVLLGATHALFWMFSANLVGVILSLLLIFPQLGILFNEWTYGRWMPLHLNWQLYGWTSLPLISWLFYLLPKSRSSLAKVSNVGVWAWSTVLAIGGFYWISGHTSGKIFLDWTGYLRVIFPCVIFYIWAVLALAWWKGGQCSWIGAIGLLFLATVPVAIYSASDPSIYPVVDESTGGPTGASLLNSTLSVVFLMLVVPPALKVQSKSKKFGQLVWLIFGLNFLVGIYSTTLPYSHFHSGQIACLSSLALWMFLLPLYYSKQSWRKPLSRWHVAMFIWLTLLICNGLLGFLPGILDKIKFTDALVAHSHLAMAGFTTSFLIFILQQILPEKSGAIFQQSRLFYSWHIATAIYVLAMLTAGIMESNDSTFTIYPNTLRDLLYSIRALCGLLLLWVSFRWWRALIHSQL